MEQIELARANHLFLVAQVPNCMFGEDFQGALEAAYVLMKSIRAEERDPLPEDFRHCGFETGYVGITAPAAQIISNEENDSFTMATSLHGAFKPNANTGKANDCVAISVKGHRFIFSITDYETEVPGKGWFDCSEDPLSVPLGQTMHRRVIIGLAPQ